MSCARAAEVRYGGTLAVVALLALSSGCTIARYYDGTPLRAEKTALVEGQSTKSDVLRVFGPPVLITHQTDGDAFVYLYSQVNYSSIIIQEPFFGFRLFTYTRQNDQRDNLVVLFDFTGVVRGVAAEHDTENMPTL